MVIFICAVRNILALLFRVMKCNSKMRLFTESSNGNKNDNNIENYGEHSFNIEHYCQLIMDTVMKNVSVFLSQNYNIHLRKSL